MAASDLASAIAMSSRPGILMDGREHQSRSHGKGKRQSSERQDGPHNKKRKKSSACEHQAGSQMQVENGSSDLDAQGSPPSALLDAIVAAVLGPIAPKDPSVTQIGLSPGTQDVPPPFRTLDTSQLDTSRDAVASSASSTTFAPDFPGNPLNISHTSNGDPMIPTSGLQTSDKHADLLSTKWLNSKQLSQLVEREGLVYKKGKFTAAEKSMVSNAMEEHIRSNNLSDAQMHAVIFSCDKKDRDKLFWTKLARAVPGRPVAAVYHYVRRKHHPMKQMGAWAQWEDDLLQQAVEEIGRAWVEVSGRVGREASDCRDRYRNHIVDAETRATGPWSQEEEAELTRIITDMTIKQGRDLDGDIFWTKVSQLMGGKRGRQQCRNKWFVKSTLRTLDPSD